MAKFKIYLKILLSLCIALFSSYAKCDNGMGQTIQIHTRLNSFLGKPSWLLVIRDLDHGNVIPYLFDIRRGNNYWVVFTYSKNYLITISNLQMQTYRPKLNGYRYYKIKNFCNLESNGRIIRGESIMIDIEGDLSPYSNTYTCNGNRYNDPNFSATNLGI